MPRTYPARKKSSTHAPVSTLKRTASKRSVPKRKPSSSADDDVKSKTHDIWRGVISFGLVEIPVALVSTEKPGGISLSLLDKRDLSPVGYRRYNKSTDEDVQWADIVHGYEYTKGRYVVVGQKDVAKADPELANSIVIDRFVDFGEVAPIQFDRSYYLEPLSARSKGYSLLRDALAKTGKAGVARMVLRTREHVGLVAVHGPSLVIHLLRFDAEIRKPTALDNVGHAVRVSPAELEMAEKLIADMTGPWRPADYVDEYTKSLLAVIQRKVKSGDVHEADDEEPERPKRERESVDLVSLLERSIRSPRAAARTARVPRPRARASRKTGTRRTVRSRRS